MIMMTILIMMMTVQTKQDIYIYIYLDRSSQGAFTVRGAPDGCTPRHENVWDGLSVLPDPQAREVRLEISILGHSE